MFVRKRDWDELKSFMFEAGKAIRGLRDEVRWMRPYLNKPDCIGCVDQNRELNKTRLEYERKVRTLERDLLLEKREHARIDKNLLALAEQVILEAPALAGER